MANECEIGASESCVGHPVGSFVVITNFALLHHDSESCQGNEASMLAHACTMHVSVDRLISLLPLEIKIMGDILHAPSTASMFTTMLKSATPMQCKVYCPSGLVLDLR